MTKLALSCTFVVLLCCAKPASAQQTPILSAPFLCQWANIQGGCAGDGWEKGYPDASSPADDNCGPTSVLMVASKWNGTTPTGNDISLEDDWLQLHFGTSWKYSANGGKGSGTEPPELASLAQDYFGFTNVTSFSGWTLQQLQQELAQGYPVIVRVRPQMEPNYPDAHYMVLVGMDQSYVYVNDPGIRRGAVAKYTLDSFMQSWAHTAAWNHNNNEGVSIHVATPSFLLGTNMPAGSAVDTGPAAEIAVASYQFLVQPFSITSAVKVSLINLQMSGLGVDSFTLWLTNEIGPNASSSNVLFQSSLSFPSTGGGTAHGATVSTPVNVQLNPGTYYLVVSSNQTSIFQGWLASTTVLPSQVGDAQKLFASTISASGGATDAQFPPASTFVSDPLLAHPLAFQLLGTQ